MSIDGAIRRGRFQDRIENLRCGRCKTGTLIQSESGTEMVVTADARIEDERVGLDYEQLGYWFQATLTCSHPGCKETVYCHGQAWHEIELTTQGTEQVTTFIPKHFSFSPAIITYPRGVPESVGAHVDKAQELLWCDPSAATNRLRVAIERMLDDIGVKKTRLTRARKRPRLSLDERLKLWQDSAPQLADVAMAAKWLGNAGSHEEIERDDACDAFEFVDHLLQEVYGKRTKALLKKVAKVNAKKGPLK